jgi:hypothetical protein
MVLFFFSTGGSRILFLFLICWLHVNSVTEAAGAVPKVMKFSTSGASKSTVPQSKTRTSSVTDQSSIGELRKRKHLQAPIELKKKKAKRKQQQQQQEVYIDGRSHYQPDETPSRRRQMLHLKSKLPHPYPHPPLVTSSIHSSSSPLHQQNQKKFSPPLPLNSAANVQKDKEKENPVSVSASSRVRDIKSDDIDIDNTDDDTDDDTDIDSSSSSSSTLDATITSPLKLLKTKLSTQAFTSFATLYLSRWVNTLDFRGSWRVLWASRYTMLE